MPQVEVAEVVVAKLMLCIADEVGCRRGGRVTRASRGEGLSDDVSGETGAFAFS